jgi:hypothetical protein
MAGIGALGFIFGMIALVRIKNLEKKLKESGVLEENSKSKE